MPTLSRRVRSNRRTKAFSLVEVVLAIGVVSFAMMAMLGTLPVGLKSVRESRGQVTTANIVRQLQGELQQLSFKADSTDDFSVEKLEDKSFFFSLDGTRMEETAGPYYKASFSVNGVTAPGMTVDPANARSVKVTVSYPMNAAPGDRQESVYSLLLAKQKTD